MSEFSIVRSNIGILFLIALSGVTLFNLCVYFSLKYTTSTNASIIISVFPIFVLTFGVLIGKEKLHKIQAYSMILSFLGALIIVSHGNILQDLSCLFCNIGDFIALTAALCWAVYVYAVKFKPKNLSPIGFLYSVILIGVILIIPLYLFDVFYLENAFEWSGINAAVILALGIGVSVIGLLSMNLSIAKFGPNTTSILYYLAPLFTSIAATLVLGEKFEYFHFIGMLAILAGVNLPLIARLLSRSFGSK